MPDIFVVDDSISVRKALEITLKSKGFGFRAAASGEEALEKLDDAPFDLLIADVVMPGISGFELCMKVKEQSRFDGIPVLLISGNVNEEIEKEAREVKSDGILHKPFKPDELFQTVQSTLDRAAKNRPSIAEPEPAAAVTPNPTPAAEPQPQGQAKAEVAQPTPQPAAQPQPEVVKPQPQPIAAPPAPARSTATTAQDYLQDLSQNAKVQGITIYTADYKLHSSSGHPVPEALGQYLQFMVQASKYMGHQANYGHFEDMTLHYNNQMLVIRSFREGIVVSVQQH